MHEKKKLMTPTIVFEVKFPNHKFSDEFNIILEKKNYLAISLVNQKGILGK